MALGLAVALARFEEEVPTVGIGRDNRRGTTPVGTDEGEQLARALGQLDIGPSSETRPASEFSSGRCRVIASDATCSLPSHPAVSFIHANGEAQLVDGQDYLSRLRAWVEKSEIKVSAGESELPEHLPQGDLYCECP